MRRISQVGYVQRTGHRRVTKRFFLFVVIVLIAAAGLFLLSRAFPVEISKAADKRIESNEEGQGLLLAVPMRDDMQTKVIVDAGHGGADAGTTGISTGRPEKEVNLEIAKKLQSILEEKGYAVVMTRETDDMIAADKDADMRKREDIIRDSSADIFVSIHQNFYDKGSGAKGPQVFFRDRGDKGYELAQYVQEKLNGTLGIKNPRDVNSGDYQLLRPGDQASVIVECGFFSNPEEEQKLQKDDYQQSLAQAVGDGIEQYLLEKEGKGGMR